MIPLRSYKRILVALLSFGPVYGVWMNDLRPPHPVPDTGPNISCLTRDSGGGHPLQITSLDKLTDQNTPAHIDRLISAGSGSNNGTIFSFLCIPPYLLLNANPLLYKRRIM